MEYVTLSNGVKMPILGYGVYQVTKDECERCVLDALKIGYRAIDTAQSYFNEEKVGKAIEKSEIDRKEREIENICMKLLLRQQPVARDLRVISSALKMISDMERIGDQAADIVELSKYVEGSKIKNEIHLDEMSKEVIKMVTGSVDSFVSKDLYLARTVIISDDIVDNYFDDIKKKLIALIAKTDGEGEEFIDLLMIAKYLERIGDHATNIAEWVEYSILGKHDEEIDKDLDENK